MSEVKHMPGIMGQSKREIMEQFKGFMEVQRHHQYHNDDYVYMI